MILKILKLITQPQPKLTSFQIKYALDQTLLASRPAEEQIGECIKKVLQHQSMMGKFENIHEELAKIGLERVEVTDDGLNFIGKKTFA